MFIFSCHVERESRHPDAKHSGQFAGFLDSARNDGHDAPPSNRLNWRERSGIVFAGSCIAGPGEQRIILGDVLSLFVKLGGRVIDSSPMYGRAEEVIGDLTSALGIREKLFLATKVWTKGKQSGIQSMERSMSLLRTNRIDLMQVHNLIDVNTQLATLQEWKQQGRIRYTGITHYESGALSEIEKLMRSQKFDFLQINYSLMEPKAEERILPLAQERGIAVIANRPFGAGDLFGKVRSKPLPDWAAEFDCRSWAQFFLKWIVANPAITCAIPATDKPRHLEDNMQGGIRRLPDPKLRRRMAELVSSL